MTRISITANWGTHQLMLRLPAAALLEARLKPYLDGIDPFLAATDRTDQHVILNWLLAENESYGWEEDEDQGGLSDLIGLRQELLFGDDRPLYLTWLHGVGNQLWWPADDEEDENDDVVGLAEPPVPAGLKDLMGAQQAFVDFMVIPPELVTVAAERSTKRTGRGTGIDRATGMTFVLGLPAAEKDAALLRMLLDGGIGLQSARREPGSASPPPPAPEW